MGKKDGMSKADMMQVIQDRTGISKGVISQVLTAFKDVTIETVAAGTKVTLVGLGSFEKVNRAARAGRNPQTGEALKVAARTVPKFKPGKPFKDATR